MKLVPPNHPEAEEALIGSILIDHEMLYSIPFVPTAAFYSERHRVIWRAIQELDDEGTPPDASLVANRLKTRNELERAGTLAYLRGLEDGVSISTYAGHYAGIVLKAHKLREVIRIMQTTAQGAYKEEDPHHLLAAHEQALTTLTRFDSVERGPADYEQEAIELATGVGGLTTGLVDLDGATGGLVRGGYNVIAARPSMGKSALLRGILRHRVSEGDRVALFSVDQSGGEIFALTAAAKTRCSLADFRPDRHGRRRATDADFERFKDAVTRVRSAWEGRLVIHDTLSDAAMIMQAARREIRDGATLIAVDHLQSLSLDGVTDDAHAVSNISRMFKALSREYNVTVVILSQLGRSVESESNKRPGLRHLRQSGAIEEDANQVLMLYRDDYYDQFSGDAGVMEILVQKNKLGRVPVTVRVQWDSDTATVNNLAKASVA